MNNLIGDFESEIKESANAYSNSFVREITIDLNSFLSLLPEEPNLHFIVHGLEELKKDYEHAIKKISKPLDLNVLSSEDKILLFYISKFAMLEAIVLDILENLHKKYTFNEIYQTGYGYANIWSNLLEARFDKIPKGFCFHILNETYPKEIHSSYISVDKDISLGEFIQMACTIMDVENPEELSGHIVSQKEIDEVDFDFICNFTSEYTK